MFGEEEKMLDSFISHTESRNFTSNSIIYTYICVIY
jgi:hypothetical protein